MPNVKGRLNHMDVDVEAKRLFVARLENGSVEAIDLQAGKWRKSIPGFKKPQGIACEKSLLPNATASMWVSRQKEASLRKSGRTRPKTSRFEAESWKSANNLRPKLPLAGATLESACHLARY
jgi:hypothetical protein